MSSLRIKQNQIRTVVRYKINIFKKKNNFQPYPFRPFSHIEGKNPYIIVLNI